ncbi:MAG: hypothetical protein LBC56_04085 [Oscillospiraceae bacterium]|jgi:hypothetical protein|nr:hypothetical protein [Oscillospiraceae bacterium]
MASSDKSGDKLLFSCLSGYNLYRELGWERKFNKKRLFVEHVREAESGRDKMYYLLGIPDAFSGMKPPEYMRYLDKIGDYILDAPDRDHFLWPTDIIFDHHKNLYFLVMPNMAFPAALQLKDLFGSGENKGFDSDFYGLSRYETPEYWSWTDKRIQSLIRSLLRAWDSLVKSGYAYHEFSDEMIYFYALKDGKRDVIFDFSFSAQKTAGDVFEPAEIKLERISKEYADTFCYYQDGRAKMDMFSDFYTMAVLLFKLAAGRLPYDNKRRLGAEIRITDKSDEKQIDRFFSHYHNSSGRVFIFDPDDRSNAITQGVQMDDDGAVLERWNGLSREIQDMFRAVFKKENATRQAQKLVFFTPAEWLAAFERLFAQAV